MLILVLPDLGGIGKSTLSEQLVAMLEIAGRPVVAIDGDPTSRGLVARRAGRRTIPISWPADYVSKAAAIRNAVAGGRIGVLDFGGGSTLTLSVDPTISDLCDGSAPDGVETVVAVIAESSKPGLASSISRLRRAYPHVSFILFRNHKSGSDWSSFSECVDLPTVDLPAMPPVITSWLSNHSVVRDPRTQEVSRPALADLVLNPQPGYTMIGTVIADYLNMVSQQTVMQDLFAMPAIRPWLRLGRSLGLSPGPMTDEYIKAHQSASDALGSILRATPPSVDKRDAWIVRQGQAALNYAEANARLRLIRENANTGRGKT